jgi:23S rRNA (cytosine1962-C5)-methyltransferase
MDMITLNARSTARVKSGYPWVFRSDIENVKQYDGLESGTLVLFGDEQKQVLATGYVNPRCQLIGRILTLGEVTIDTDFFYQRFNQALHWREQMIGKSRYFRLIHAESDNMPGLIVDLFGRMVVCQTNTAGMERLKPLWLPALEACVQPYTILCRDDTPVREIEGLELKTVMAAGDTVMENMTKIIENDTVFLIDVWHGQKTGWFYDQRPHRLWIAQKSVGKKLLDVFCHTGGFGVTAARYGAIQTDFVDSSAPAMDMVRKNLEANNIATPNNFYIGKAFDVLDQLKQKHALYDVVCVDPPAFVKSKNDLRAGLNGYTKLARQAAHLVKPGGLMFFASCSSHPTIYELQNAVQQGIAQAKRSGALVYHGTAGSDHPQHPQLPETGYLKALAFRID